MFAPEEKSFDQIYNNINEKRKSTNDDFYIAEHAKLPATVLRLAAVLYVLEGVSCFFFEI